MKKMQTYDGIEEILTNLKDVIISSVDQVVGRRRGTRREQWIKKDMWDLIDKRKDIKIKRDTAKSEQSRGQLGVEHSELNKIVKKKCREDKKAWIEERCRKAEEAAQKNDSRTLYKIAKELSGTSANQNIPIKNKQGKTLTSEDEQKQRWVEHFDETLNQPEPVSLFPETAFQEKMVEIDANMGVISFGEVEEAIKTLKANKASGEDGIQAELLKHGGDELTEQVTKLLNKCWEHGTVPEEWTRGVIVKLPKKEDWTIATTGGVLRFFQSRERYFAECCYNAFRMRSI